MYEDFNYITDNNFLSDYWLQEKITRKQCQGDGKVVEGTKEDMISSALGEETGKVHRHQLQDISSS
ncbi:MAG: hypothetical protein QNJ64_09975 [Crocosphaera sp.]|nr:hypothetical protein [Crocosphaera sp.]